jgi:Condensation domain
MPGKLKRPGRTEVHPVTWNQRYMLDQDTDPDCRDDLRNFWVLSAASLVKPRVDLRRLRRAAQKLNERHDSLRIRLDWAQNNWRALIDPPGEPQFTEIDVGDVDDATFFSEITAIANAPMPLVGGPLAELIVVHCGQRGDVIVTRVHHAITDGYGMIVLTEDLMKYLIGLPIMNRAVSHAEYISRFENPSPERAAEINAYWTELHRDFPTAPLIGRKSKKMEPLWRNVGDVIAKRITVTASRQSLAALDARSGGAGASTATAMFAGFLEGLCLCYDVEQLMFVTHVARTDPGLETYMGDHTLDPVIKYFAAGKAGMDLATRRLGTSILEAIDHLPAEAARRGTPWEDAIVAGGGYPGQFSAHQPRAMTRRDRSVFRDGLKQAHGVEQKIGPYILSTMDVSVFRRGLPDLQFSLGTESVSTGFSLKYDGIAYTETEISNLSEKICDLLELEITGVTSI